MRTNSSNVGGTAIQIGNLTARRYLARNVLWNLLGSALPLIIGLFAIPVLIEGLGTTRFGLLAIIWSAIGYFNLFDLGLGRALTKMVAERLATNNLVEIAPLVRIALYLMLGLGILGSFAVIGATHLMVERLLTVPDALVDEARGAFYLLSVALPFVVLTSALRGVLEAYQRFRLINAVRIPLGIFMFMGPVLVLPYTDSLVYVVATLVVLRLAAWLVYLLLCLGLVPAFGLHSMSARRFIVPLIRFGGWMTVTNIVGPIMVYFDRFLIGAMLTMTAVTYYATPYEVVTKLWIFPGAIIGVMFPALATTMVADRNRANRIFRTAVKYVLVALVPPSILFVTFAPEVLTLWLDPEFAENSSTVLRWLMAGVLINSAAQLAFALIQGAGRPDLTAKTHLAELPIYLCLLWFLVQEIGVVGAAVAWTIRVGLDGAVFFFLSLRLLPEARHTIRLLVTVLGTVLIILVATTWIQGLSGRLGAAAILLLSAGIWLWRWNMPDEESRNDEHNPGPIPCPESSKS